MNQIPADTNVYIHLGLPKTASTFLQDAVFPRLEGIQYVPKHQYRPDAAIRTGPSTAPLLLTCEKDHELLDELGLVRKTVPGACILLVFRRPYSWLVSKYKYSIRKHGHLDFPAYLAQLQAGGIGPGFYRSVIERLQTDFPGRHLVLDYDELRTDPALFLQRITEFTGAALHGSPSSRVVKPAFSERKLVRLRRFNRRYRYAPSTSSSRLVRFLHYKYREFLLHITAFLSGMIPADTRAFRRELADMEPGIERDWAADWLAVRDAAHGAKI